MTIDKMKFLDSILSSNARILFTVSPSPSFFLRNYFPILSKLRAHRPNGIAKVRWSESDSPARGRLRFE